MKQKISTFFQRKLWLPFFAQGGLSLVELLIGSVMLVTLSFGFTEFLISVQKNISGTEKKLGSILWSQYILESLITNPECLSPCTTITSSCTNTFTQNVSLINFEDTTGTEIPFTSLYSPSTNTNPTPLQLFVSNTDPNYDPTKHHYSGLYIDTMVIKAGSLAADARNNEVTLNITFKEVSGSTTALISRALSLVVMIDEYQSNDSSSADYNKIKKCHFSGSATTGAAVNCYTVDTEDAATTPDTGKGRALVGCGGTSTIQRSETTAFGYGSGQANTGYRNTFVGYQAGASSTTGSHNIFMGYQAGYSNTGSSNIFMGSGVGYSNTGYDNIFMGSNAGYRNTTGSSNIFMGSGVGRYNTTGYNNTFVGYQAGYANTTGAKNIFIGDKTGTSNTIGKDNVFIGYQAGFSNTTGDSNTFVGYKAGRANTSSRYWAPFDNQNTFIGAFSGTSNTTGFVNTFVGYQAGYANTTGANNTFIGKLAGYSNTTGYNSTFMGSSAGYSNIIGYNTFMGYNAGYYTTTGWGNTFMGSSAGYNNTNANYNTFMGHNVGYANTTGASNTFVGYQAGYANTTGANNIFIGESIGSTAGGISHTEDEQLNIGNLILGKIPSTPESTPAVTDLGGAGVVIHGELIVSEKVIFKNDLEVVGDLIVTGTTNLKVEDDGKIKSSRVYKKNIKSFTDFDKSLDDIVNTSLFHYEYKKNHPDKTRMGIISEELPKHLQILDEGSPSRPDWVSIYGTLWAGIKAIVKKMNSFKKEFLLLIKKLEAQFNQAQESYNQTKVKLQATTTELKETRADLDQTKKQWNKTTEKLNTTTTELKETKQSLLATQKILHNIKTTLQNQDKRLLQLEKQKQ